MHTLTDTEHKRLRKAANQVNAVYVLARDRARDGSSIFPDQIRDMLTDPALVLTGLPERHVGSMSSDYLAALRIFRILIAHEWSSNDTRIQNGVVNDLRKARDEFERAYDLAFGHAKG